MWNKLTGLILILVFSGSIHPQVCNCISASADDKTRQGGNEIIALVESKTYKSIQGKVFDINGEELEGVLVEVFDKAGWIKENKNSPPDDQKRLYACITGKDGSFCFPKFEKGDYEVRFSKDVRWNPTYMFLQVNPDDSKASEKLIELYLTVGT
jgi:hypothetical protein